jgi:hypothetical protein
LVLYYLQLLACQLFLFIQHLLKLLLLLLQECLLFIPNRVEAKNRLHKSFGFLFSLFAGLLLGDAACLFLLSLPLSLLYPLLLLDLPLLLKALQCDLIFAAARLIFLLLDLSEGFHPIDLSVDLPLAVVEI